MVSFGTDMPGRVSHPDIQRLNQHLESGSHTPLKCVPNTGRVCAWNARPLGHCLLTLPPLGGALLTCSFSQPHSPLPPAAFTLRKVNSTPSGYLPLLLPGDRGWCHFTSTDFNKESLCAEVPGGYHRTGRCY